ncbi:MAG TPA: hypothetical protein VLV50_20125 [Stellaceae bacterium]|nr:hypothetical protein [Stellaceae bacterium]
MMRPFLLSLAFAGGIAGAASASELVVVSTHGLRLTPGQTVDGSQSVKLDDGQQVTFLAPNGQVIEIDGPFNGAPDSQVRGGGTDAASAVTALLTERQARTSEVGVVRGENDVRLPDPWVVDVTHPGTSCVISGHEVVLWRSQDLAATQVSIAPADRSWSVSGNWPASADRLAMPQSLPLKDRTSYVINIGGKLAPVTVRVIPASVSNDAMRASWMAEVGCDNQASALLTMLKK